MLRPNGALDQEVLHHNIAAAIRFYKSRKFVLLLLLFWIFAALAHFIHFTGSMYAALGSNSQSYYRIRVNCYIAIPEFAEDYFKPRGTYSL